MYPNHILPKRSINYLWRASLLTISEPVVGDSLFIPLTQFRKQIQKYRYTAPAQPFKCIEVTPSKISRWNQGVLKGWGLGQIRGGDWDTNNFSCLIEENPIRRGLRQRFIQNRAWDDTIYVEHATKHILENGSFWGYQNISEFKKERCAYVDELYESIREQGYNSNSSHDVPDTDIRQKTQKSRHQLEPLVSIGRNGDVFYVDGIHRFTIAEILDINIPVNVLARHRQWQEIRDQVATAETVGELNKNIRPHLAHPDLDNIKK